MSGLLFQTGSSSIGTSSIQISFGPGISSRLWSVADRFLPSWWALGGRPRPGRSSAVLLPATWSLSPCSRVPRSVHPRAVVASGRAPLRSRTGVGAGGAASVSSRCPGLSVFHTAWPSRQPGRCWMEVTIPIRWACPGFASRFRRIRVPLRTRGLSLASGPKWIPPPSVARRIRRSTIQPSSLGWRSQRRHLPVLAGGTATASSSRLARMNWLPRPCCHSLGVIAPPIFPSAGHVIDIAVFSR